MNHTAHIGVTGLAVMGANLARNLARHGYRVAIHNRSAERTNALATRYGHEGRLIAAGSPEAFVQILERPRKIIIMVRAGAPTDAVIDTLTPLLDPGDIIMDAGNAHFTDTIRRQAALDALGIRFLGVGVSGGEEGALLGPSIMPGGCPEAYRSVSAILTSIAAQVDDEPCCTYIGPEGAGHFVKMVHNGIEYADMQLIAEAYDLLRYGAHQSPGEIADTFATWNDGDLESFLIQITADVLGHVDASTGAPFIDIVADRAGQKGTGGWTVQTALDLGTPVSGIAASVFARSLSGQVEQRDAIRAHHARTTRSVAPAAPAGFADDVRTALHASKVIAYAQGFDMIQAASRQNGWDIDPAALAGIWRGGCIIRARFLNHIRDAYHRDPELPSLLVDPYFAGTLSTAGSAWRRVIAHAVTWGVPTPGFAAALTHYDALHRDRLPAALLQGLRDFFGAHTYQRIDRDGTFHTQWSTDRSEVAAGEIVS